MSAPTEYQVEEYAKTLVLGEAKLSGRSVGWEDLASPVQDTFRWWARIALAAGMRLPRPAWVDEEVGAPEFQPEPGTCGAVHPDGGWRCNYYFHSVGERLDSAHTCITPGGALVIWPSEPRPGHVTDLPGRPAPTERGAA